MPAASRGLRGASDSPVHYKGVVLRLYLVDEALGQLRPAPLSPTTPSPFTPSTPILRQTTPPLLRYRLAPLASKLSSLIPSLPTEQSLRTAQV